jgi:hypothetical protein
LPPAKGTTAALVVCSRPLLRKDRVSPEANLEKKTPTNPTAKVKATPGQELIW